MFHHSGRVTALALALSTVVTVGLTGCSTSTPTPSQTAAYNESLHALLPQTIRDSGVITVGSPYNLKPSIFADDSGEPTGISVDLSKALGEVLGVSFKWQQATDPVTALQSGNIEVSMGYLSDSPSREAVLTMVPQYLNTSTLLVPAGSTLTDIESMCGKVLAVVAGSQQEARANRISTASCAGNPITVTSFSGAKDAITQVQSGRAAAFAAPRMILEGVVSSSNGAFAVTTANYPDFPFAMGVTKDNGDLAQALAGALKALFDNGRYASILADWNASEIALTSNQIGVNTGSTNAFDVNK